MGASAEIVRSTPNYSGLVVKALDGFLAALGSGFSSQKSSCTAIAISLAEHSLAGRGAVELSLWKKLN